MPYWNVFATELVKLCQFVVGDCFNTSNKNTDWCKVNLYKP